MQDLLAISIIDSWTPGASNQNVQRPPYMRYGVLISMSLAALLTCAATPSVAATFGTVVPIGGHASDIALDESRGLLYIANFTANRIEVMSIADRSIRTS